jgi:LCP family protein required for cell wall assembly
MRVGSRRHQPRRHASADGRRGPWARFRSKSWGAQLGYSLAAVSAALVVAIGVTGYAIYQHLESNITSVKVGGLTGRTVHGQLNILVLGSQQRAGQHGFFGYEADPETANSDNLLLVHLDASHSHATVLSIPRDMFVYEPACKERPQTGTGVWPAQTYPPGSIIDGALNIGGPTCAVETVEDLTGIKLDHVIVFDFNSFRTMVDAIGGVEVCVPPGPGYHDLDSHLNLSPGLHRLYYNAALAYVRTRHAVGSGSQEGTDLARIQLQQSFISSVAQEVEHENLFSNLPGLLRLADTATKALTVDKGLGTVPELLSLARSLESLKSKDINLITVPTTTDTYPGLSAHLMAVQPQDDILYQMVRTGQAWPGHLPTQPVSKVKVVVENGTGQSGLAATTRTALEKLGFDVTGVGDASYTPTTTVDYAGLEQADSAYTLMTKLNVSNASNFAAGDNTLAEPASLVGTPGAVKLILGADFSGVIARTGKAGKGAGGGSSRQTSGPSAVESRNAGANICSGLPPAYVPGG